MGRGTRPGVAPRPADVRPVHPVVEPGRRTPRPRRGGAPRHRIRSLALGGRLRVARRFPPREPAPCGGGSSRQSSGRADDGQPPTGLGPGRILCADRLEHSPTPRLDRVRTPRDGAGDRHRDEEFSGTLDGGVLRPDLGRGHDGSRPRGSPGGRPKLARALRDLDRVRLDDRRRDRPRTPSFGPQRSARPGGRPLRRDRFAPPGTGPCRRDADLLVAVDLGLQSVRPFTRRGSRGYEPWLRRREHVLLLDRGGARPPRDHLVRIGPARPVCFLGDARSPGSERAAVARDPRRRDRQRFCGRVLRGRVRPESFGAA